MVFHAIPIGRQPDSKFRVFAHAENWIEGACVKDRLARDAEVAGDEVGRVAKLAWMQDVLREKKRGALQPERKRVAVAFLGGNEQAKVGPAFPRIAEMDGEVFSKHRRSRDRVVVHKQKDFLSRDFHTGAARGARAAAFLVEVTNL